MKTQNLILLLVLIVNSVSGQSPGKRISIEDKAFVKYFEKKGNIPVVKGKILNITPEEIEKVKVNYSIVTPLGKDLQDKKSCQLKQDGSFELELDYAFPYQQIWITVGKWYYAGICANTDLYIELDAEILKSKKGTWFNGPGVKYQGQDGELNAFLNNHILFKREKQLEIDRSNSELRGDRKLSYDDFIARYDSLYGILRALDNEFIKQNPSSYSWILINERQSDYYGDLCAKHWGKVMPAELFKKIKDHKAYLISNSGMSFYNYLFTYVTLSASAGKSLDFKAYRNFSKLSNADKSLLDSIISGNTIILDSTHHAAKIKQQLQRATMALHDTLVFTRVLQGIALLDELFDREKSDFLKTKFSSDDPVEQKLMMEAVQANVQTAWCKKFVQERYDQSMEKIASINKILQGAKPLVADDLLGQPVSEMPSGAKLYKVENIKPEALLENLKSSFHNKALLIDFWATWCGPCIEDMPYSEKLHDNARDLPVEFVYLCTSTNSSIDKWKAKVAQLGLSGTHIFVEENIERELMKLFSANGFPTYVFIDTKGDYKPGAVSRMSLLDRDKLLELVK